MRRLTLATALLAVVLAGCGSDSDPDEAAPTATVTATVTSTPTETSAPAAPVETGEPAGCRVAASKWADRAGDHVLDLATTAPAFGETVNLDNLDDPLSTMEALCSQTFMQPAREAMVHLTEANFEISLCSMAGSCRPTEVNKVRGIANRAAGFVGDMRNQI